MRDVATNDSSASSQLQSQRQRLIKPVPMIAVSEWALATSPITENHAIPVTGGTIIRN